MPELDEIDAVRRDGLKQLLAGAAFAVPVVATIGLTVATPSPAAAQSYAVPTVSDSALPIIGVGLAAAGAVAIALNKKPAK